MACRGAVFIKRCMGVVLLLPAAVFGADRGLDQLAEDYVRLGLQFQTIEPLAFIYTGPTDWRDQASAQPMSPPALQEALGELQNRLETAQSEGDLVEDRRRRDLIGRVKAMRVRADVLQGRMPRSFDEEVRSIFGTLVSRMSEAHFASLGARVEQLVPGDGPLAERLEHYREQFVIPPDRLESVIGAAIAECRRRTREHYALPDNESVRLNITSNQHWVGFTQYLGNSQSVIHINSDVPVHIERAVELGCHEAYPGHHVHATLIEQELVNRRGWMEYAFIPLHGPLAITAEGAANVGVDLAFSRAERIEFERQVLLPLAGMDGVDLVPYYRYLDLLDDLNFARNEVARRYLYEGMPRDNAVRWLMNFGLETRATASQRLDFIDAMRTYVVAYNHGKSLVADYLERQARDDTARRWAVFRDVLVTPLTPLDLSARHTP